MLTRQKLRGLFRKKLKAEKSLFKAEERIKLRGGNTTEADQNLIRRATATLYQIEQEVQKITLELQGATDATQEIERS